MTLACLPKGQDNVMIELVFTTNGTDVTWASKLIGAIRAADASRLIVLPAQWATQLLKYSGQHATVISCGAGSNCTGAGGYQFPPPATSRLFPALIDSGAPSDTMVAAANSSAARDWAGMILSTLISEPRHKMTTF